MLKIISLWATSIAAFRSRKFNYLANPRVARFFGNLAILFLGFKRPVYDGRLTFPKSSTVAMPALTNIF